MSTKSEESFMKWMRGDGGNENITGISARVHERVVMNACKGEAMSSSHINSNNLD